MWKKIKRNNNYSINETGAVRNDKTGHIKQPFTNMYRPQKVRPKN